VQFKYTSVVVIACSAACTDPEPTPNSSEESQELLEDLFERLPNNFPVFNPAGFGASYQAVGFVDLRSNFATPQGSNGRDCATCHPPEDGWSIKPLTVTLMFLLTDGTHEIFANNLDTDTPNSDMTTVEARWNSTTMLRQGKFTRRVTPPVVRDYEVIAANDPFGVGTTTSLWFFRRPLPTANFRSHTVMWDAANTVGTVLRDGLIRQARGNVTGAQQGTPAPDGIIFDIVDYEAAMGNAQLFSFGAGRLDADGARGGPEAAAAQLLVDGRFDLYDAWARSRNAQRKQIWRGQEIFNNVNVPSGRSCRGCHNAANNGQNVNGVLFNIGTSRPEFAKPDMAVYTFQRISDGAIVESTDPGRGIRNGLFADLNKFKTPNLRGLASRAPYFHNGIADTLEDVVQHYETALGFVFTPQERRDLVAFLEAL
jgi:cytochrome c peroxidase